MMSSSFSPLPAAPPVTFQSLHNLRGKDLCTIFERKCSALRTKVSRRIVQRLRRIDAHETRDFDLSRIPAHLPSFELALECIALAHGVHRVSCRGCDVSTMDVVDHLCHHVSLNPSVTSVDVSQNPKLDSVAAMALVALARHKQNVFEVVCDGCTGFDSVHLRRLEAETGRNRRVAAAAAGGAGGGGGAVGVLSSPATLLATAVSPPLTPTPPIAATYPPPQQPQVPAVAATMTAAGSSRHAATAVQPASSSPSTTIADDDAVESHGGALQTAASAGSDDGGPSPSSSATAIVLSQVALLTDKLALKPILRVLTLATWEQPTMSASALAVALSALLLPWPTAASTVLLVGVFGKRPRTELLSTWSSEDDGSVPDARRGEDNSGTPRRRRWRGKSGMGGWLRWFLDPFHDVKKSTGGTTSVAEVNDVSDDNDEGDEVVRRRRPLLHLKLTVSQLRHDLHSHQTPTRIAALQTLTDGSCRVMRLLGGGGRRRGGGVAHAHSASAAADSGGGRGGMSLSRRLVVASVLFGSLVLWAFNVWYVLATLVVVLFTLDTWWWSMRTWVGRAMAATKRRLPSWSSAADGSVSRPRRRHRPPPLTLDGPGGDDVHQGRRRRGHATHLHDDLVDGADDDDDEDEAAQLARSISEITRPQPLDHLYAPTNASVGGSRRTTPMRHQQQLSPAAALQQQRRSPSSLSDGSANPNQDALTPHHQHRHHSHPHDDSGTGGGAASASSSPLFRRQLSSYRLQLVSALTGSTAPLEPEYIACVVEQVHCVSAGTLAAAPSSIAGSRESTPLRRHQQQRHPPLNSSITSASQAGTPTHAAPTTAGLTEEQPSEWVHVALTVADVVCHATIPIQAPLATAHPGGGHSCTVSIPTEVQASHSVPPLGMLSVRGCLFAPTDTTRGGGDGWPLHRRAADTEGPFACGTGDVCVDEGWTSSLVRVCMQVTSLPPSSTASPRLRRVVAGIARVELLVRVRLHTITISPPPQPVRSVSGLRMAPPTQRGGIDGDGIESIERSLDPSTSARSHGEASVLTAETSDGPTSSRSTATTNRGVADAHGTATLSDAFCVLFHGHATVVPPAPAPSKRTLRATQDE